MKSDSRIVLLCADGDSTRAVAFALENEFGAIAIVMEEPISRFQMAKRRAKKLGLIQVFGQVLFITFATPVLRQMSRRRIEQIEKTYGLNKSPSGKIVSVVSVNSAMTRDILRQLNPEVVVVNGTRIISEETLNAIDAPFINIHAGITPLYRGVHGAYWALAEGRNDLVGTTVHLVDKGIDTGNIIEQVYFDTDESDNFATYPYLHTGVGIPVLIDAVKNTLSGTLKLRSGTSDLGSKLRYHPTIWRYIANRLTKGVE
ncbi:formyl transferase [soil metagenome]